MAPWIRDLAVDKTKELFIESESAGGDRVRLFNLTVQHFIREIQKWDRLQINSHFSKTFDHI